MADYDVAIVGLGPVGCTAAIMLAEAGLTVAAVERDEAVYALPRAVNLDGELIRAFQKVDRGQAVQDLMQKVRPGDRAGFANSKREWLFGSDAKPFGRNGWQPMNMFDQPELESYLRAQALQEDRVRSFIGVEVTDVEEVGDAVALSLLELSSGHSQSITASYVVACDGASSFTRRHLGIGWKDLGYDHDWLVVDVTTFEGHTLDNSTVQVCDPDRIVTYVCTKDPYRRWEFKLLPGESADEMMREETIMSLIDPWTPRGTYAIRRAAVYQFHAANAEQWRIGRIFLAGDAAHQTPPFLGQGMNSGMRDAVNLAWKLPLVLSGTCDQRMLDSYFAERDAHAHDLVDWAVSIGRLMDHIAEEERCARAGLPAPPTPPKLQSSGYGQGREQPPIRGGIVRLEQVSDTGSVGYLFSQPIVRDEQGHVFKLDERLGSGFAVVARNGAELDLNTRSVEILDALDARVVSLSGLAVEQGRIDRLFEQHDAAIVRPDRLVYGHTDEVTTLDDLLLQLSEQLALTT